MKNRTNELHDSKRSNNGKITNQAGCKSRRTNDLYGVYQVIFAAVAFASITTACTFNLSLGSGTPVPAANLDQLVSDKSESLIKSGKLTEAVKLLEQTEDQRGLTSELSDKLDRVYIALAKQAIAKGNREKAAELLQLVPPDAEQYKTARSLLQSNSATKKKSH